MPTDDPLSISYNCDTDQFERIAGTESWVQVASVIEGPDDFFTFHAFYSPSTQSFYWRALTFQESNSPTWFTLIDAMRDLFTGSREDLLAALIAAATGPRVSTVIAAIAATTAFDYEASVIAHYEKLRTINRELEDAGSRLSGAGEYSLANKSWAASADIHARRTELHPGYIRAKNLKAHRDVAPQAELDEYEEIAAAIAERQAEPIDWASVIITELGKHVVSYTEGSGYGPVTSYRCTCGHEEKVPRDNTYHDPRNGYGDEYLQLLQAHRDTAAANSAAALIQNLVSR